MSSRPNHIDLGNEDLSATAPDLPSPRSGEVPPALSPLDAFALQSRLLAQQLDATRNNGRRVSRLPPLTIANELARPRPGYFSPTTSTHSQTNEEDPSSPQGTGSASGASPDVAQPLQRPQSHYPLIHAFDDAESVLNRDSVSTIKPVYDHESEDASPATPSQGGSALKNSIKPPVSPPDVTMHMPTVQEQSPGPTSAFDLTTSATEQNTLNALQKPSLDTASVKTPDTLAVPGSPSHSRPPWPLRAQASFRSARSENADDSDSLSLQGDLYERKLSNSSAFRSRPRSPFSLPSAGPRSPSISSEHSGFPRASINFSRPISRAGRPETRPSLEESIRSQPLESPPLRASSESPSFHGYSLDSPRLPAIWGGVSTPLSMTDDERSETPDYLNGVPSYTYAKYSLPRGRVLSRNSILSQEQALHKFEWEPPRFSRSNVTPVKDGNGNDKPQSLSDADPKENRISRMLLPSMPAAQPAARSRSADAARSRDESSKARPSDASTLQPLKQGGHPGSSLRHEEIFEDSRPSTVERRSLDQGRNPDIVRKSDSLKQLTPEGHLAKGIQCHEDGEVQKSTYHLRLAARGGNATAMLLYALACRHGWGMRPNQAEGVQWLRKAVDSSGLEVADDESGLSENGQARTDEAAASNPQNDVIAKRVHKAQFALSIYELGVSYMNGWGIQQDKQLALRCFEISGSWGDGDALAEAGFCYAKGVGCKKDLKKAADFYRRAEKRGVEMAGNSWIYKEKYMLPSNQTEGEERRSRSTDKDKKSREKRDKSRTRTFFGGRRKQPEQLYQLPPPPHQSPAL